MPSKQKRKDIPQRTDDIEVKIKGVDYSNDLHKLNIISSLASPYPIFEFSIAVDPDEIILDGVFGEDPIKLFLRTVSDDGQIEEEIDMELMLLDTDQSTSSKPQMSDEKRQVRSGFNFMAVPVKSFETITTNINAVYINTNIRNIIENLVRNNTYAKPEIDTEGINTDPIEQVVIPPTTLYRIIKESGYRSIMDGYLDNQFGLYNGIPAVYCTFDNRLKIMNLTKRIKKTNFLKIYQLSESEDSENIYDRSSSGKAVYTFTAAKSSYSGNTKFSSISKDINYITKPSDSLYQIINKDLDNVIAEYGLIDKNKKVQKNSVLSKRRRYNINHTGNEDSETFSNSDISSLIGNLSSIELDIYGNFSVESMMNIGNVIKFEPSNIEQTDVHGKYIMYSTFIKYSRSTTEWNKECSVRLVRSNKTN